MSQAEQQPGEPTRSNISPSAHERIHKVCQAFEEAWKRGEEPRIEDFLGGYQGSERSQLLHDLLVLEIDCRIGKGETLSSDDYRSRFPEEFPRVEKALQSRAAQNSGDPAGKSEGPDRIGKYKVLAELSRGGQAVVYRAVHPRLEKEVVIKLGRPPAAGLTGDGHWLISEGKLLAEIEHPHIARIHDLDFHEGRPFLVMEYARGRSLAQKAMVKRFPPREAASLIAKVARALQAAHDRGVVHLDVKPENIVLDGGGEPKLIDFGLATFRHFWGESPETEGICGTLPYMPPEQAQGKEGLLGPPTDLFALGAVLYFLLTEKAPYDGVDSREVLARARACDFDRQALRRAGAPRPLERICQKAMQANPAARHHSAGQLASELEAYLRRPVILKWALAVGAALLLAGAAGWLAWPIKVDREANIDVYVFRNDTPLRLKDAIPLKTGDGVQIRAEASRGLSASLFWFDSEGHLLELPVKRKPLPDAREEILYPSAGESTRLEGPPGTELVFLCAGTSGKPVASQVGKLLGEGQPLPEVVSSSLLLLEADGVRWSGQRGPGPVQPQPPGVLQRLESLRRDLIREKFEVISGVAFPRK